ncbi:hypothetical protein ASD58_13035 [Duganella sp. Root1480D1]|nr:hypothetical protein ASD58_13035 [Duganella sp. Root1480D1]
MPQSELVERASDETYMPKFFAVNGRIGRVRYLGYSVASSFLLMPVFIVLLGVMGVFSIFTRGPAALGALGAGFVLGILAMIVLAFATGIIIARRRLHDLGKSGWLSLLMVVPLVSVVFWLWLVFGPGDADSNEYGPPPGPNSTGVIILAAFVPVMFVLSIMASIALPGYASYKAKAEAAQIENSQ